ncbi:hypothetical protein EDB84DRAFT_1439647 [Lactarius hengduanensis]|nr:hypothetical protein EDB84DRAFT_1439647 [Lactarius hengduanensis]
MAVTVMVHGSATWTGVDLGESCLIKERGRTMQIVSSTPARTVLRKDGLAQWRWENLLQRGAVGSQDQKMWVRKEVEKNRVSRASASETGFLLEQLQLAKKNQDPSQQVHCKSRAEVDIVTNPAGCLGFRSRHPLESAGSVTNTHGNRCRYRTWWCPTWAVGGMGAWISCLWVTIAQPLRGNGQVVRGILATSHGIVGAAWMEVANACAAPVNTDSPRACGMRRMRAGEQNLCGVTHLSRPACGRDVLLGIDPTPALKAFAALREWLAGRSSSTNDGHGPIACTLLIGSRTKGMEYHGSLMNRMPSELQGPGSGLRARSAISVLRHFLSLVRSADLHFTDLDGDLRRFVLTR